jgi:hypothetical protein
MSANDKDTPLPADLPASAPVLNDLEGGHGHQNRIAALRTEGDGSATPVPSESSGASVSGKKEKKGKKRQGMTDGDHGELSW